MIHSRQIRGEMDLRTCTGQPWDLFEILRQEVEQLAEQKDIKDPGSPHLVRFVLLSRFYEYTDDGKIVGDERNECKSTDIPLSRRWEQCMDVLYPGTGA